MSQKYTTPDDQTAAAVLDQNKCTGCVEKFHCQTLTEASARAAKKGTPESALAAASESNCGRSCPFRLQRELAWRKPTDNANEANGPTAADGTFACLLWEASRAKP